MRRLLENQRSGQVLQYQYFPPNISIEFTANGGNTILPKQLSSGEKLLISFLLCLYSAENWNINQGFTNVLLLDEVDAFLHPAMCQTMLDILSDSVASKLGIKVILVTHSPSTVALANEDSIFIMRKDGPDRLLKATKDKALATLTVGVPTLSIDYSNRKFVFVEGPDDENIYPKLFGIIVENGKLEPSISLTFIGADVRAKNDGAGGCQVVISTLQSLEGNKSIFGIIDWDGKNNSNGNLMVLGENKRRCLENYLFEPLPMLFYSLRYGHLKPGDLGQAKEFTYSHLKDLSEQDVQKCIDKIIEVFEAKGGLTSLQEKNQSLSFDSTLFDCETLSGIIYKIPKYFLDVDGKTLIPVWQKVFGERSEKNLKDNTIDKVFADEYFYRLLPKNFFELFQRIQAPYRLEPNN